MQKTLWVALLVGSLLVTFGACETTTPTESTGGDVAVNVETTVEVINDAGGLDNVSPKPDVAVAEQGVEDRGAVDRGGQETTPGEQPTKPYAITVDPRGRAVSMLLPAAEFAAWNAGKGFQARAERERITKEIYQTFQDAYDFIFFVMNNEKRPNTIPFGQLIKVSNAVEGIGMRIYNNASRYGSAGKLKAVMQLGRRDYLLFGPSLHELLHNWSNFALPTKMLDASGKEINAKPHWGISDVGGQHGGFDPATFKDNVDNNPKKYRGNMPGRKAFGFNSNGGNGLAYSNLELYLMGLIPKDQVRPVRVFSGVSAVREEFIANGTFSAEKVTTYTIDQMVGAPLNLGERKPGPDASQKEFRVLAIMLTPTPLDQAAWDAFDKQIAQFSFKGKDSSRIFNFFEATGGRATVKMDENDKVKK